MSDPARTTFVQTEDETKAIQAKDTLLTSALALARVIIGGDEDAIYLAQEAAQQFIQTYQK